MGIIDAANVEQWKGFLKKLKEETGLKLPSIVRLFFKGDNGRRHDIKNIGELRRVFDEHVEKHIGGNDVITLHLEVLGYDQVHLLSRYKAQQGVKVGIMDMPPIEVRKIVVPESWFNLNSKDNGEPKAEKNWRYSNHYRQLAALYNYDEERESKALDKRPPVQNVVNVCGVDENTAQDMMRSFERLKGIAYAKDNDTDNNDKQYEESERYNAEEKEMELKNTKQSSRDSVIVEIAMADDAIKDQHESIESLLKQAETDAIAKQQEPIHAYNFEKEKQSNVCNTFEQEQRELACDANNDKDKKKLETNADQKKKEELNTRVSANHNLSLQFESVPLAAQTHSSSSSSSSNSVSQSGVQKQDKTESRNSSHKKRKHKQTGDNSDETNFNGLIESIDKLTNAVNTFNQSANQLNQSVMQWSLSTSQMGMPVPTALGYSVCTPYNFQPQPQLQSQLPSQPQLQSQLPSQPQLQSQQPQSQHPFSYFPLSFDNQQTRLNSTPQLQSHTPFPPPFNNTMYPPYLQQAWQNQQQQRQQIAAAMQQMQQSLIQVANRTNTDALGASKPSTSLFQRPDIAQPLISSSPVIASIPSFNASKAKTGNKNPNETNVGSLFNYPDSRTSLPLPTTNILSSNNDQNNVSSERLRRARTTTTLPLNQPTLDQI